jgi:hypothetical protein
VAASASGQGEAGSTRDPGHSCRSVRSVPARPLIALVQKRRDRLAAEVLSSQERDQESRQVDGPDRVAQEDGVVSLEIGMRRAGSGKTAASRGGR